MSPATPVTRRSDIAIATENKAFVNGGLSC